MMSIDEDKLVVVKNLHQINAKIEIRLAAEAYLTSDAFAQLSDLQEYVRAPQSYFAEASKFVRNWL